MKYLKASLLIFLFLFTFSQAKASLVNQPIVTEINPNIKDFSEPFISGFTDKYTNVLLYIDGNYFNDANISSSVDRDVFYFFIDKLFTEGEHTATLISRDLNGVMSAPSKEFSFYINHKLPTPKILECTGTDNLNCLVESLNQNTVNLYLDGNIFNSYYIEKNSNNTANIINNNISSGNHSLYFIDTDNVGRTSPKTQIINLRITPEAVNKNEKEPVEETSKNINDNEGSISKNGISEELDEDIVVEGINNIDSTTDESSEEQTEKLDDKALDNILNKTIDENETTGSVAEDGANQGDLKWNLVIFLGFLLAVILWVIWVNRETSNDEEKEEGKEVK